MDEVVDFVEDGLKTIGRKTGLTKAYNKATSKKTRRKAKEWLEK